MAYPSSPQSILVANKEFFLATPPFFRLIRFLLSNYCFDHENPYYFRWRSRNRLSYLRSKSSYDSSCQPTENSEHPLIYDDANIHFYRGAGPSSSSYLLDHHRPIVRDTSGLSQQVHTIYAAYFIFFNKKAHYFDHYLTQVHLCTSSSTGIISKKFVMAFFPPNDRGLPVTHYHLTENHFRWCVFHRKTSPCISNALAKNRLWPKLEKVSARYNKGLNKKPAV